MTGIDTLANLKREQVESPPTNDCLSDRCTPGDGVQRSLGSDMTRYLARKILIYLLTFFVAVSIDWAIPRLMPGDPIDGLISRMQADPAASEELHGFFTESFELDSAALEAVPQLLVGAPPRRPRAEHRVRRLEP